MSEFASQRKDDDLPPALRSMWRLCKLGYQHEPALMSVAFGLALLAALPEAMLALGFAFLANAVDDGDADFDPGTGRQFANLDAAQPLLTA